jgi:ElaB/YqjD/DUF883 family membrane-anchored ribosome-binding protein
MAQETKTAAGPTAASDYEAMSQQLAALRADLARLSETVTGIAGRRSSHMAADIAEGFDEARHYAERTGRSAEKQLETSVAEHPLLAIGLAAGAGLLVGAMSRR